MKSFLLITSLPSKVKAALLFFSIFVLFLSPGRFLGTHDGDPARYLPISIIFEGNLELREIAFADSSTGKLVYSLVDTGEHIVSKYPILPSFLALPVYLIPSLLGVSFTGPLIRTLAKISASLITAFSALFLFFILKRFVSERWSIILTLAYALGTSNWTISAQDLWQHGASQLFLVLTVFILLKARQNQWFYFLTGLFSGLAVTARPLNAVIIFFVLLFVLHRKRNYFLIVVLGILLPMVLLSFYNTYYFGWPWSTGYETEMTRGWANPFFQGLAGLLVSPSRGLLIYSPFLVFGFLGGWLLFRHKSLLNRDYLLLFRYFSLAAIAFIFAMSKWYMWYGGYTFGSRMLVDIIPLLIILFVPVIKKGIFHKKIVLLMFTILLLFSVGVQLTIILVGDYSWDDQYNKGPKVPLEESWSDQAWLWDWKNSQLLHYFKKLLRV